MTNTYKHFHRIAWAGVLLTLCVIVFGGFVRLSNAGLSCPDWPTCYGRATWPVQDHEVAAANVADLDLHAAPSAAQGAHVRRGAPDHPCRPAGNL